MLLSMVSTRGPHTFQTGPRACLHLRLHVLLRANGALPKLKGQRLHGRILSLGWHYVCAVTSSFPADLSYNTVFSRQIEDTMSMANRSMD